MTIDQIVAVKSSTSKIVETIEPVCCDIIKVGMDYYAINSECHKKFSRRSDAKDYIEGRGWDVCKHSSMTGKRNRK